MYSSAKSDMLTLATVQKMFGRLIPQMKVLFHEERMSKLGLYLLAFHGKRDQEYVFNGRM